MPNGSQRFNWKIAMLFSFVWLEHTFKHRILLIDRKSYSDGVCGILLHDHGIGCSEHSIGCDRFPSRKIVQNIGKHGKTHGKT